MDSRVEIQVYRGNNPLCMTSCESHMIIILASLPQYGVSSGPFTQYRLY